MYSGLLHSHNGLRWLVLLFIIVAVLMAITGWFQKKQYKKSNKVVNLLLIIFMDLQFVVGFILYAFVSPITKASFANFGAAMKNSDLRFYAVEHIFMMTLALILVHIGYARRKKDIADWRKHKSAAILYGIALILILAGIPWDRALF